MTNDDLVAELSARARSCAKGHLQVAVVEELLKSSFIPVSHVAVMLWSGEVQSRVFGQAKAPNSSWKPLRKRLEAEGFRFKYSMKHMDPMHLEMTFG